jgi:hypothetical protein
MKNRAVTVLESLLQGGQLEYQGRMYAFDEENRLCVEMSVSGGGLPDRKQWLPVHMGDLTLSGFIAWAEKIPGEAVDALIMDMALNSHRRSMAKRR